MGEARLRAHSALSKCVVGADPGSSCRTRQSDPSFASHEGGSSDLPHGSLRLFRRCRVSTGERPRNNALQILLEAVERDVSHLDLETLGACMVCLPKGDIAAQRGLDCETLVIPDMVFNECFELFVHNSPDFQR